LLDLLQDLTKGTAGAQPTSPSSGVPSDEQALRERGSQVRWLKDVDRNLKKHKKKHRIGHVGRMNIQRILQPFLGERMVEHW